MRVFLFLSLFLILFTIPCKNFSAEYVYILNDKCIKELYNKAEAHFYNSPVKTIKDSRGIILRYTIENFTQEYYSLNTPVYKKIEDFLAKIENPAIIEVHTGNYQLSDSFIHKNWELSTIMANNIEAIITKPFGTVEQNKINSIGYGEFLPAKNTSNNGGENSCRVDIIILCNIGGE